MKKVKRGIQAPVMLLVCGYAGTTGGRRRPPSQTKQIPIRKDQICHASFTSKFTPTIRKLSVHYQDVFGWKFEKFDGPLDLVHCVHWSGDFRLLRLSLNPTAPTHRSQPFNGLVWWFWNYLVCRIPDSARYPVPLLCGNTCGVVGTSWRALASFWMWTRYLLVPLAATMIIATIVNVRSGFAVSHGGAEFPLLCLCNILAVWLLEPGSFSLSALTLDEKEAK